MFAKRNVGHYAKIIAKETGYPLWKVHIVLMFGWRNIIRMIERQEDVRIKRFGKLYIDKSPRPKTK